MKNSRFVLLVLVLIIGITSLVATTRIENFVEAVYYNEANGMYTAYFGYLNPNPFTITIPTGDDNTFNSHSQYNNQLVTSFAPGRHIGVIVVSWPGNGALVWKLRTPNASPTGYATATAALSIPFHDDDEDGVINNDDDYPNDPERAYDNETVGNLAYEDLWPDKGDYDMNDMVLDYNFNLVTNAQNQIKEIIASFKLRAVGAAKNNSFLIEFPFPISAVGSFAGSLEGQSYPMTMVASGNRSVLKVINGTASLGITTGNGIYWNTQMNQPKYPDKNLGFTITMATPIAMSSLPYLAPFNPYILSDSVPGKEVHLPGMTPTADANPVFFNTGDDTTNPAANRYYKTSNNLPWAIHIPISWTYPIERAQVTSGYLAFKDWAESGGVSYPTWYILNPSTTDTDFLYTK